ncbi:MAG TPA: PKD domain-containing protein [Microthrixaceae bacterium]|nr:PKD domain-containing protein [Microthrixaceae bacterium]
MNRGQAGTSLLDILIGITILLITVGGIASATMSAGGLSTKASDTARINVLLTAFGESLKNLPYQDCATADRYQVDFDNLEDALGQTARKIKGDLNAALTVESVANGPDCPGEDSGVQTIVLKAAFDGREHSRTIVKRTLVPKRSDIDFDFFPTQLSSLNDPLVVWQMSATGSSPIFQYEWWCEGAWATVPDALPPVGNNPIITHSPDDPSAECRYPAPNNTGIMQTVALRVTELGTNRTAIRAKPWELPVTPGVRAKPEAKIEIVSSPACTTAQPCVRQGTVNTPGYGANVTFASTGMPPVDAGIVEWIWSFGDGTPQVICTTSSSDPTGAACANQSHLYTEGGEFFASLKLRDAFGTQSDTAIIGVVVEQDHILRPKIDADPASSTVSGNPPWAISPQTVQFTGSARAYDAAGNLLPPGKNWNGSDLQYSWDFGNAGAFSNTGNASYSYPQTFQSTIYNATFTVVALVPGSTTETVVGRKTIPIKLDPLEPPRALRVTRQKGDIWLIRNAYFDFQWTNVPRRDQDVIRYEFALRSSGGFCGFFGSNTTVGRTTGVAGPAGTGVSYRFQFSSSPRGFNGICTTDSYNVQARSVMDRPANPAIGDCPAGKACSQWSAPIYLDPEFF